MKKELEIQILQILESFKLYYQQELNQEIVKEVFQKILKENLY